MTCKKQILVIFFLTILLGLIHYSILEESSFTLIKKERIVKTINSFNIPKDMTAPMSISLKFAKYLFDMDTITFIDARDSEDFNIGHIKNSINIPYDYYEDYEEIINELDDTATYVIYCNGEECSLSMDLAEYLFNELSFEKLLIFEGGWPEWRDSKYPTSENNIKIKKINEEKRTFDVDTLISWMTIIFSIIVILHFLSFKSYITLPFIENYNLGLSLLPRIILGIVFILASYHKILDPLSFSDNINNFHITPEALDNIAALLIPWLELILGVFLILGLFLRGSSIITICLYIFFIFILTQALIRGIDVHCGCFKTEADAGSSDLRLKLIKRIGEDLLLLGMAFLVQFKHKIILSDKEQK